MQNEKKHRDPWHLWNQLNSFWVDKLDASPEAKSTNQQKDEGKEKKVIYLHISMNNK